MLIVDLIRESFDSEVPYTVVRAGNDWFTTRANINGRMLTFNAASYSTANGYNWEIDFSEKSSQSGTTFAKTGNGGEMQVFSFVIASIKELIARYAPAAIEFASHKADGNRSKLYQRMLGRIRIPGYHLAQANSDPSAADDFFKIVRESIDPDLTDPKFKHSVVIGKYTYTAEVARGYDGNFLIIDCWTSRGKHIGRVRFATYRGDALVSDQTEVHQDFKQQGIASTMYAYAKMLGGDIRPSKHQLPPGKAMWAAWKKSGDAKHLGPAK